MKSNAIILIVFFVTVLSFHSCNIVKHTFYLGKGEIHKSNFIDSLHYETKYGIPIISVSINGSNEYYKFLFDMGAISTIISSELSEKLNLESVYHYKTTDSQGKTIKHGYVKIDSIRIGNTNFYDFVAGEITYPENSILRCALPDGIIGANIMKDLIWQIDYKNENLLFSDKIENFNISNKTAGIKMSRKPPSATPYIKIDKDGDKIRGITFDTGSSGGVSIPLNKKNTFEQSVKLIDQSTQGLFGAGADTTYISENQVLKIGSIKLDSVPVEYNFRGKKNIGNAFLKNFLVTADFRTRNIYLKPNETIEFDRDDFSGYGFYCSIIDTNVIVTSLYKSSPADMAGMQINDTITHLNDKPIHSYFNTLCDFYDWSYMFHRSGESIILRFKGRKEPINLKPGKYLKSSSNK